MGFYVVEGSPKPLWVPIHYTTTATPITLYIGQIVWGGMASTPVPSLSGFDCMVAASGIADASNKHVPFGVVSGLALRSGRTYSSTYLTEYDTSVNTQDTLLARDTCGVEGMISKSDPIAAVQITRIMGTSTVLKGPIFLSTLGTAPTVCTVTTGDAAGLSFTAGTDGITTPLAYAVTTYCRSGLNMGHYRVLRSASATARQMYIPFAYDIAIGDTFVDVPMRVGTCFMDLDSLGMFIDGSLCSATNDYIVNCWDIDLKVAGKENATFSFTGDHFCAYRA